LLFKILSLGFPEEIKQLEISKYKEWKEKIEQIHLDKLFYHGLKKET